MTTDTDERFFFQGLNLCPDISYIMVQIIFLWQIASYLIIILASHILTSISKSMGGTSG